MLKKKYDMNSESHNKPKIILASTIPSSLNTFYKGVFSDLSEKYEVIALSSPGKRLDELKEREQVRTIGIPMERHISIFRDIIALWRVFKAIKKEKPTMVHSITPKAGLLCMIASWVNRIPVRVHTFTGLWFPTAKGFKRFITKTTDSIICFCATNVIPEGEGVKNDLISYKVTHKPMRVLGHGNIKGVDMNYYSHRPEVMDIVKNLRDMTKFTYLFVGRIVGDKGINELSEAFSQLYDKYPQTRLFIIGGYERQLDPISEKAANILSNHPAIHCVGYKRDDELIAYYASADCFVFPSYREGFPNTVLEAGALGLPSIVTDINGSREIIIEGKNGTIIPPRDSKSLYNAMERMLKDDKWREGMASNARELISSRYEQGYVRKCLYDFYNEIIPT